MKKYFSHIILVLILGSTLLFSNCLKDNKTTPIPIGGILLVNAYSDANSLMFYAENNPITTQGLEFKHILRDTRGSYLSFLAGSRTLSIHSITDGQVEKEELTKTTFNVLEGFTYSAFAFGSKENAKISIVKDETILLKDGESGVRFFNLAEDIGAVTLSIEGKEGLDSWIDRRKENDETIKEYQDFESFDEGKYTLTIKDENGNILTIREGISFKSGRYKTLFLTNNIDDKDADAYYIGVLDH